MRGGGATRSVVFSQWTGMLDLVAAALKKDRRLQFCRLDGGMSAEERQRALKAFRNERGIRVMLLSLKVKPPLEPAVQVVLVRSGDGWRVGRLVVELVG